MVELTLTADETSILLLVIVLRYQPDGIQLSIGQ